MTSHPVSRSQVSNSRPNIDPPYYPIGNGRSIAESASQGGGCLGQRTWLVCYSGKVPTSGRFDRVLIGPLRLLSRAGRLPVSDERLVGGEANPGRTAAVTQQGTQPMGVREVTLRAKRPAWPQRRRRSNTRRRVFLSSASSLFLFNTSLHHDTRLSLLVFCVLRPRSLFSPLVLRK